MQPLEPWCAGTQVERKGEANTDDIGSSQQRIALCPRGCTLGHQGVGYITPDGFRRPGLGILNLEYATRIHNLESRIDRSNLCQGTLANSAEHQDIDRLHFLLLLRRNQRSRFYALSSTPARDNLSLRVMTRGRSLWCSTKD